MLLKKLPREAKADDAVGTIWPNEERLAYQDLYLTIDFRRRALLLESRCPVELTSKEYAVLAFHAGNSFRGRRSSPPCGATTTQVRTRTLDVHRVRVRKKTGPASTPVHRNRVSVGMPFSAANGRRSQRGIMRPNADGSNGIRIID